MKDSLKSSFNSNIFDENTVKLLMAIQYRLPLTETPLVDLAEQENLRTDFVIKKLRELKNYGALKRYGANLNYRAFFKEQRAALVAAKVEESRIYEVAKIINSYKPKHNYWREHEFNVWFTVKAESVEKVKKLAEEIVKKCNIKDYVILPTKRVYKIDVKYNLIEGISWSENSRDIFDVPKAEELGYDISLLKKLERLEITERPFKGFRGYTESELVDIVKEIVDKGIARDFSGVLKERKIGFKENGMTVIKTLNPEKVLKSLIKMPEITHLVERIVPDEWNYPIYFMTHAVSRDRIEEVRKRVEELDGVEEAKVLYSREDLNP